MAAGWSNEFAPAGERRMDIFRCDLKPHIEPYDPEGGYTSRIPTII